MKDYRVTPRLFPNRLSQDSFAAVFSPSSSVPSLFPERMMRGEMELTKLGINVRRGRHVMSRTGYTAGTASQRAEDLTSLFADPSIDAIHCSIGGNNTNQILSLLDYEVIRSNPKVLVGYSDATALLIAAHVMTGLVTYHGPAVLPEFGENAGVFEYTKRSFLEVLFDPRAERALRPPTDGWTDELAEWSDPANRGIARKTGSPASWRSVNEGRAMGPLIGGNLETLLKLAGTPFWPTLDGAILFWEAAQRPVAMISACLTQLAHIGVLNKISGMLVGRPYHCETSAGISFDDMIDETFKGAPFPVVSDVDLGHTDPMLTLPIGVVASLEVVGESSSVLIVEPPAL